jgi:hypothetical protein
VTPLSLRLNDPLQTIFTNIHIFSFPGSSALLTNSSHVVVAKNGKLILKKMSHTFLLSWRTKAAWILRKELREREQEREEREAAYESERGDSGDMKD